MSSKRICNYIEKENMMNRFKIDLDNPVVQVAVVIAALIFAVVVPLSPML